MPHTAVEFVRSIGLPVLFERPNEEPAFNPDSYVWVHEGGLYVDPEKFHVGDFLHEAGHLAVLPSFARKLACGDVEESTGAAISAYIEEHGDKLLSYPEDPIVRACFQCGEVEAIAWSYAAAVKVGVDPYLVFENGFRNEDERQTTLSGCRMRAYFGINGLRAGGFFQSVQDYPRMVRWLAP
jgi:hypothetical protein